MKKILLIVVAIIILVSVYAYYNNNNQAVIISALARKAEFKSGDLQYKVNLLGFIPIGEAVLGQGKLQEYSGKKVYHLSASAESAKIWSNFFNAKATLDSYVDAQKMSPVLFKQKIEVSGRQNVEKEAVYDQNAGTMDIGGIKYQILPDTQDALSAIFNLRRMDLAKIREFELNINTNRKNYLLKGTVSLHQLSINKKVYVTALVKATISRRNKNPYHQSQVTMVLLREKENIPILIRVFASGILISAKLADIR